MARMLSTREAFHAAQGSIKGACLRKHARHEDHVGHIPGPDILIENARTPFTDIAKKLLVSAGTIHVRVKKMEDEGINI